MSTKHKFRLALWLLTVLASAGFSSGCGGYPPVSPEAYELAKLLDNACNVRQADQLPVFRKMVIDTHAAGDIDGKERTWLLSIADTAAAGEWDQAAAEIRRLLLDQNRAAPGRR